MKLILIIYLAFTALIMLPACTIFQNLNKADNVIKQQKQKTSDSDCGLGECFINGTCANIVIDCKEGIIKEWDVVCGAARKYNSQSIPFVEVCECGTGYCATDEGCVQADIDCGENAQVREDIDVCQLISQKKAEEEIIFSEVCTCNQGFCQIDNSCNQISLDCGDNAKAKKEEEVCSAMQQANQNEESIRFENVCFCDNGYTLKEERCVKKY